MRTQKQSSARSLTNTLKCKDTHFFFSARRIGLWWTRGRRGGGGLTPRDESIIDTARCYRFWGTRRVCLLSTVWFLCMYWRKPAIFLPAPRRFCRATPADKKVETYVLVMGINTIEGEFCCFRRIGVEFFFLESLH